MRKFWATFSYKLNSLLDLLLLGFYYLIKERLFSLLMLSSVKRGIQHPKAKCDPIMTFS